MVITTLTASFAFAAHTRPAIGKAAWRSGRSPPINRRHDVCRDGPRCRWPSFQAAFLAQRLSHPGNWRRSGRPRSPWRCLPKAPSRPARPVPAPALSSATGCLAGLLPRPAGRNGRRRFVRSPVAGGALTAHPSADRSARHLLRCSANEAIVQGQGAPRSNQTGPRFAVVAGTFTSTAWPSRGRTHVVCTAGHSVPLARYG